MPELIPNCKSPNRELGLSLTQRPLPHTLADLPTLQLSLVRGKWLLSIEKHFP